MEKRRWMPHEEQYLRDHCDDTSIHDIAKALNRSLNAVQTRKTKLGLTGRQRPWTEADKNFLEENNHLSNKELAAQLDRSVDEVAAMRRRKAGGNKKPPWTPEQEEYLQEHWGQISISAIAKKLGRSVVAIKGRASKLGLGRVLLAGDYITLSQLICAVTGSQKTYSYKPESWVKKRGLPVHTKCVNNNRFRVVYLDEFWAWAEQNRSFLDFSKMEPLILGKEPDWVVQQRRIDAMSGANQRKDPWTPFEDQRLRYLLKQHKFTWAEMARDIGRSEGAIQRRCNDLGIKDRPVRESPTPWTGEQLQTMANMIRQGCSYSMIGYACGGRSEKSVRGVVFQKYHTENADKVRAMLGDGSWGTGAPEPTVKSEKHKETVRKPMARLCGLLLAIRNSMDFGEYWQKDMCQHWDAIRGCTMHCTDCDSCTSFQRIRPQYCRMCGGEFLERAERTYCPKCRAMRKKQAQRKYAILARRQERRAV